jgi:hypothetical protein
MNMQKYVRLINVFLLVAIGVVGFSLYGKWAVFHGQDEIRSDLAAEAEPETKKSSSLELTGVLKNIPDHSLAFYQEIIDKNLFREDRSGRGGESEASTGEQEMAKAAASHRFILYGVAVVGDERRALLGFTDTSSDTKGRRSVEKIRTVKVGDEVKDFTVSDIKESTIVLSAHQETLTLNVYDPKNPRARKSVRTAPTVRPTPVAAAPSVSKPPHEAPGNMPMPPGQAPVPQGPEEDVTDS